nr:hypothetical protein [Desulfobacterales bacterium]
MERTKTLIIHQGALGDLILSLPAILKLKIEKKTDLALLCPHHLGRLIQTLGIVVECFSIERACFSLLFSDEIDSSLCDFLRRYERIIVFSFSDMVPKNITRIGLKEVYRIPPRPPIRKRIHVSRYIIDQFKATRLLKNSLDLDSNFRLSIPGLSHIEPFNGEKKRIVIHPGSGSRRKWWALRNFLELSLLIRKIHSYEPIFILGPAEIGLRKDIEDHANVGPSSLYCNPESRLLISILKEASIFLGNDSGVTHLAASLGIPTLAIFGPSDPIRWKPVGPHVKVVRLELDCEPCFEISKENCATSPCLNNISSEMALEAVSDLILSSSTKSRLVGANMV